MFIQTPSTKIGCQFLLLLRIFISIYLTYIHTHIHLYVSMYVPHMWVCAPGSVVCVALAQFLWIIKPEIRNCRHTHTKRKREKEREIMFMLCSSQQSVKIWQSTLRNKQQP